MNMGSSIFRWIFVITSVSKPVIVCHCTIIDVGEGLETEVGLGKLRASLSCLLFLPQMRKTKLLIKKRERDTINSALVHGNSKENVQS